VSITDKFTASVNDTGDKLMTGVKDTGDKTLELNISAIFRKNLNSCHVAIGEIGEAD